MNEELIEEIAPSEDLPSEEAYDEMPLESCPEESLGEDPQEEPQKAPEEEKEDLMAEIESLKAELESRSKTREKYLAEFREFSEIFGKDTLDNVPPSVWERVEEGVPLAAAYALYEKKNAILVAKAEAVNKKNASMTAGAIKNAAVSGFFSPSEVKAMSAKEVKKNYDLIIESMKKWN